MFWLHHLVCSPSSHCIMFLAFQNHTMIFYVWWILKFNCIPPPMSERHCLVFVCNVWPISQHCSWPSQDPRPSWRGSGERRPHIHGIFFQSELGNLTTFSWPNPLPYIPSPLHCHRGACHPSKGWVIQPRSRGGEEPYKGVPKLRLLCGLPYHHHLAIPPLFTGGGLADIIIFQSWPSSAFQGEVLTINRRE